MNTRENMILVVEGSRIMGQAACDVLNAAGFEAFFKLSATEAFIACQERKPDLVLTEYRLAEEDGLDLLKKLRRLKESPPAVMVSALGSEETAASALNLGALNYWLKTADYLEELPALALAELEAWRRRKNELEKRLKQSGLEAQNELAGWLDHNFKNILAASLGSLNLIDFRNTTQDDERRKRYLSESVEAQQSALDLLAKISRLGSGADLSPAEDVDVGEAVAEAWAEVQARLLADIQADRPRRAEQFRVRLEQVLFFNSARRLGKVKIIRRDLSSLLEALLRNALEAVITVETPRILVLGERVGPNLELTVRDNGRGMDEHVLRHATEALFSTKGEVGVGLGLSLVNNIVERYGGELILKSKPGAGTSVKLSVSVE